MALGAPLGTSPPPKLHTAANQSIIQSTTVSSLFPTMATRKVRVKKLNVKLGLDVLTEDEIDASEYHALTQELQVATGVDAAEEGVRTESRETHVTPQSQPPNAAALPLALCIALQSCQI